MEYDVVMTKKATKGITKLPLNAQMNLAHLVDAIKKTGPVQPSFRNYSKLSQNRYHCHLDYHWVACWQCENGQYVVEVYYVGSRESAPY